MSDVACTNPDCPERGVPKNSGGFDAEDIQCGACGQPVEPVDET